MPTRLQQRYLGCYGRGNDAVVREFAIAGDNPRSGKLAIKIVESVRAGERNKDTLVRKAPIAIEELSKSAKR